MASERSGGRHVLAWYGVDPDRVEAADVVLAADRLEARGTSLAPGYVLRYWLETGPAWATRRLAVHVDGDGWWRSLDLRRDDGGRWRAVRGGSGAEEQVRLPDALPAAVDCDLGLCPLTNTMPVRREGLLEASRAGEARRVELVMAWVAVPELEVLASPQVYEAGAPRPDGGAVVHFSSEGFEAAIELDRHGLVLDYPGIAHRARR